MTKRQLLTHRSRASGFGSLWGVIERLSVDGRPRARWPASPSFVGTHSDLALVVNRTTLLLFSSPRFSAHQKRVLVITDNVVEHSFFLLPELSCSIDSGRSAQNIRPWSIACHGSAAKPRVRHAHGANASMHQFPSSQTQSECPLSGSCAVTLESRSSPTATG